MDPASQASDASQAAGLGKCCAYGHVVDGEEYLVDGLFPQVQHIPLAVGQDAAALLEEIDPDVRWFAWHSFLTFKQGLPRDRDALAAALHRRGILQINEHVLDGSKRHTQSLLAQLGLPTTQAEPQGDPEERLFFKSNYNFGGVAERRLAPEVRDYFGVALPHESTPLFRHYQAVRRRQIKAEAFEIADIFIERYVANRAEVFFRAFVCFDAVILSRLVCKGIIKKALDAERRDDYFFSFSEAHADFLSAPDDLVRRIMRDVHRFCRAFKLDMGAVDILLDDAGVPYIIDVNPTAFGGANLERPGIRRHMTQGLLQHARSAATPVT